ncbi:nitroreductase family protein [Sphingomonas sp. MMS24-J13]|uniref:nitroreductase family protein n=1 Tax=Sphingomonas sp. MMS24-J13 TaxID=3238686 RepID=UPI00384C7BC1
MELIEAIYSRRAVRAFTPDPIDRTQLGALIDAAIQAPTAMNSQLWSFCVVTDQGLLQRASDAAKAHMLRSSPAGLVSHHFEEVLANPAFHIFYHAPALILISAVEEGPWGQIDCALAAENLMLAAAATGLGSCWIGFAQGWLGTADGKAALGLPAAYMPVAPIIVGHPLAVPQAVPRKVPEIRWLNDPS